MVKRIFDHRFRWILLFCLVGALAAWQASYIGFVYDLEQFFPADDEDLNYLHRFQDKLERDDLFVLMAFENEPSIYDSSFLNRVHHATLALKKHPQVALAEGLTTFRQPIKTPFGWNFKAVIRPEKPENYSQDSLNISSLPDVMRQFVSIDHRALAVSVKTKYRLNQKEADALQWHIDSLCAAFGLSEQVHFGGVITTQTVFVQKIQSELLLFISLSVVLVTIVLWLLYRTFWGVLIPLVTVVLALVVFLGYLGLTRQDFNVMSTMFPTLMLIFGMSDIIHLQSKYLDGLHKGLTRRDSMLMSLKEIGLALWLTSLTTSIGFASLLLSSTPAIQQFGLNAAIGVLIAFVVVILFGGATLSYFDAAQLQKSKEGSFKWDNFNLWLFRVNKQHPKRIMAIITVLVVVCLASLPFITTNSYLLGDIPERSRLRDDFKFFENAFSGVRPFEIALEPQSGKHVFDEEVTLETLKLLTYLEKEHGIKSLYSPAGLLERLHQAENPDIPLSDAISKGEVDLPQLEKQLLKAENRLFFKLWSKEADFGRISGRIRDTGSDSLAVQIVEIKNWIDQHIRKEVVSFRPTGSVLLVDKNHEYLRKNLFYSLGFAFLLVALLFGWLFKDWRMVLVSIIPNLIPMLVAGATLAFTGIELKAVTSVIFTVSFGIAVDDTIHFLTRYKLQRKRGDDVDTALRQTFLVSVKAITITTILLVVGFVSLIFSSFTGTYYVGILICITLVSAWLSDIFVIPQLLYFINPGSRRDDNSGVS